MYFPLFWRFYIEGNDLFLCSRGVPESLVVANAEIRAKPYEGLQRPASNS